MKITNYITPGYHLLYQYYWPGINEVGNFSYRGIYINDSSQEYCTAIFKIKWK